MLRAPGRGANPGKPHVELGMDHLGHSWPLCDRRARRPNTRDGMDVGAEPGPGWAEGGALGDIPWRAPASCLQLQEVNFLAALILLEAH